MNRFSESAGNIALGNWSFNVIKIGDIDLFSDYIKRTEYPANLWSSNFAFLWAVSQSPIRKVLWRIVDDMLVTFGYMKSGTLYLICLPFGPGNPDKVTGVLYKCLKYCDTWNGNTGTVLKVVNSMQVEFLEKSDVFNKYFRLVPLMGLEKHFSIQNLLSLPGKEFETVRRKINKFHRLYPNVVIRKYRTSDFENAIGLGNKWNDTSGQKYSHILDSVYFPSIIKHCSNLDHLVLVVELNAELIGMVSGGELPTGQSWWCLSKFLNEYSGLSELLIVELAKEINKNNPNIELMNAAEDMGPGGLRFFKERFRPVLDLKRYAVKLR